MEKVYYPVLKEALEIHGEIDMKVMIAQALQMGDEDITVTKQEPLYLSVKSLLMCTRPIFHWNSSRKPLDLSMEMTMHS